MIFNPTGSWPYHFKALRARRAQRWSSFQSWVEERLFSWQPSLSGRVLLVFGPSAGHCLSWRWLSTLGATGRLIVVEPDAVSRLWFLRRARRLLPDVPLEFASELAGELPLCRPFIEGDLRWRSALQFHKPDAVLFCNCLGQLPLISKREWQPENQKQFLEGLAPFSWASFHDLISIRHLGTGPSSEQGLVAAEKAVSDLATRLLSAAQPRAHEVIDHETEWLFSGEPAVPWCHWPLTETQSHIIVWIARPTA